MPRRPRAAEPEGDPAASLGHSSRKRAKRGAEGKVPVAEPTDVTAQQDSVENTLSNQIQQLLSVCQRPEEYFQPDTQRAAVLASVLKWLYDYAKSHELDGGAFRKPLGSLSELHVQGFDPDSIWAQLQLRNGPLVKHLKGHTATLLQSDDISLAAELSLDDDTQQSDAADSDEALGDNDSDADEAALEAALDAADGMFDAEGDDDSEDIDDELDEPPSRKQSSKAQRKEPSEHAESAAERDGFFDWDDMERVADEEHPEDDDELGDAVLDEIYGTGSGSALDGGDLKFEDFFTDKDYHERRDGAADDAEYGDRPSDDEADSEQEDGLADADDFDGADSADEAMNDPPANGGHVDTTPELDAAASTHARAKQKMQGKISELEQELLQERPWALRGEVTAKDRPENSLLEAALDVERATRVAPVITVEKTASLEEIIKERILAEKFDDVAPKNIELPVKASDAPAVSMEKSAESLAAIYEKEYLKRTLGVEDDDPDKPLKEELKVLFLKLNSKLDALCNFHFTPKPVIPEIAVKADLPAIAMEEALPAGVSNAEALAPEEVYAKKRGREAVFLEESEQNQTERHRARLAKKKVRNQKRRQTEAEHKLVAKANPGLGNPYEKQKLLADIRNAKNVTEGEQTLQGREFSTSSKFFGALQQQVQDDIRTKAGGSGAQDSKADKKKSNKAAALRL